MKLLVAGGSCGIMTLELAADIPNIGAVFTCIGALDSLFDCESNKN